VSGIAGIYDIVADQGATFTRVIVWKDSNGVPIDVSGYSARMQLRSQVDSAGGAVFEFTSDNGRISLGGTAGTITLSAAATATAAVAADTYVYDLELEESGVVTRLVQGQFELRGEVTR
jgi:hypothetical protein